ncbi:DUF6588 family protein [Roseivirga sp. BDSF3-8]|uniref:DUF6588 family protein n=1 Tax=Roseivirga sp. BDSF3-8 TaxID=3241598 RepID=UPI003531CB6A
MNKLLIVCALMILGVSGTAYAQLDIDRILVSGRQDAEKITEMYVSPLAKGFASGLNNGWYITAKPHESLGFNLSISVSASLVPDEDEYFLFRNEDFTNIRLTDSNLTQAESPTVMGAAQPGPNVTVYNDAFGANVPVDNFDLAEGIGLEDEIGFNAVPAPMVTLGVGIIKNTDLVLRFVPELKNDDGSFYMYGLGLKHDIKQWIPGVSALPFDLSVFSGYTKLNGELNLEGTFDGDNQRGVLDIEAKTIQVLAGKKVGILNVYAGLGYDFTRTTTQILGEYVIAYSNISNVRVTLQDPVDFAINTNTLRATAGFGLKLGPIALNGDYSIAEYHTATVGLSVSVN